MQIAATRMRGHAARAQSYGGGRSKRQTERDEIERECACGDWCTYMVVERIFTGANGGPDAGDRCHFSRPPGGLISCRALVASDRAHTSTITIRLNYIHNYIHAISVWTCADGYARRRKRTSTDHSRRAQHLLADPIRGAPPPAIAIMRASWTCGPPRSRLGAAIG